MWLIDWFRRPSYVLSTQTCAACAAHREHIADLQALLKSERDGYAVLLAHVIPTNRSQGPSSEQLSEAEMKPLRQNLSIAQKRKMAEEREKAQFPDAQKDYWTKVQSEYEKVGKLPT